MKIDCIKTRFKDENGRENVAYKYRPIKYCCDKLKDFEHIDFVDEYDGFDANDETDDDGTITPRFSIIAEEPEPWEEATWPHYYKINYCPFCGERIDVNIIKDIDVTEEYLKITKSIEELEKKQENTDSKKESKELEREIQILKSKQSNAWEFGEYHEYV